MDRAGARSIAFRVGTGPFPRHRGVTKVCPIRPKIEFAFILARLTPFPCRILTKEPPRLDCQAVRSRRNELTIRVC